MADASKILLENDAPSASKALMRGKPSAPKGKKSYNEQQLNDELAQDIIASSKNNPLVRLGIDAVGVEQLTTLFKGNLTAAEFAPKGYDPADMKRLGHDPKSPVDLTKPTVVVAAKNMSDQGLATSRSDMGHEYLHAGISALADFKKHNIGESLEEAIARHHEMVTGNEKDSAIAKKYFEETYKDPPYAHKVAKKLYEELSVKAADKLDNIISSKKSVQQW